MDKDLATELKAIRKLLEILVAQTAPGVHVEDVQRQLKDALSKDEGPKLYDGVGSFLER